MGIAKAWKVIFTLGNVALPRGGTRRHLQQYSALGPYTRFSFTFATNPLLSTTPHHNSLSPFAASGLLSALMDSTRLSHRVIPRATPANDTGQVAVRRLYCGCMATILPKSPFAFLSLVVFWYAPICQYRIVRGTTGAGFQLEFDPAEMDRHVAAAAVMVEVEDLGFELADDREQGGRTSREVIEADRKYQDQPLAKQFPVDDPLPERAVRIAAVDDQDHPAAGRISTLCPGPCSLSDDAGSTIHQTPKILVLSLLAQIKCITLDHKKIRITQSQETRKCLPPQ